MNGVVERCEKTVAGRAVIPEGVTRIGKAAFKDCISLQWVRIPSTVTEIGEAAFAPRNRRRKFRGEDVRNYAYNEYIDWEGEYRVEADFDFVTQVIIAQSITHIHSKAFEDLDKLESIVFPDTFPFCDYDSFDLGIVWEHFDYET